MEKSLVPPLGYEWSTASAMSRNLQSKFYFGKTQSLKPELFGMLRIPGSVTLPQRDGTSVGS